MVQSTQNDSSRHAQCRLADTRNSAYLSLLDGLQRCFLDAITVLVKLHVAQHHAGTQQQGRGVGLVLPSYVWSCAVNLSHKTQNLLHRTLTQLSHQAASCRHPLVSLQAKSSVS